MKRIFFKLFLLLVFFLICLSSLQATRRNGFPWSFPDLMDEGGNGQGNLLFGFGGLDTTQDANQKACKHIPIILLHGNGSDVHVEGDAESNTYGRFKLIRELLIKNGYNDSEIWAVSYLGDYPKKIDPYTDPFPSFDMKDPYRNNIADVRKFIDAVIDYLEVERVIIIGYSLGAVIARAYLNGLYKTDSGYAYDTSHSRYDKVAALITIAGANYGFGENYKNLFCETCDEFITHSNFEELTHYLCGFTEYSPDDTPFGAGPIVTGNKKFNELANTNLPVPYKGTFSSTTVFDHGVNPKINNRIFYCGISSQNDMVDVQYQNTGYLQGADINKKFYYSDSEFSITLSYATWWKNHIEIPYSIDFHDAQRHLKIVDDDEVFNKAILPIINHANLYYPQNNPRYSFPTRWLKGFFITTSIKLAKYELLDQSLNYPDIYNYFFDRVIDTSGVVLTQLKEKYGTLLSEMSPSEDDYYNYLHAEKLCELIMQKESTNEKEPSVSDEFRTQGQCEAYLRRPFINKKKEIAEAYKDMTLWLNSFGVTGGYEDQYTMEPSGHFEWALRVNVKTSDLVNETNNRLNKIWETASKIDGNIHNFLSMWFASESIYLRDHCMFDNDSANSNKSFDHFNWAQSKSKNEVINDLLYKYDYALTFILTEGGTGKNNRNAFLKFYAESAERLAMWGARYIIEINYDNFPPDPEPADYQHFAIKALFMDESQIREDLKRRIKYVAEFLSY